MLIVACSLYAISTLSFSDDSNPFLPVNRAFQFSGYLMNDQVYIDIKVADGYYLYKDQLRFTAKHQNIAQESPTFPPGELIFDPFEKRKLLVLKGNFHITFSSAQWPVGSEMVIHFQGCAERGLCYAPHKTTIKLYQGHKRPNTLTTSKKENKASHPSLSTKNATVSPLTTINNQNIYSNLLNGQHSWWVILGLFFIAGIMLTFTPCVLPMIPILSATLVNSQINRRRTLLSTVAYILGMSITYAVAGILMGLFGATLNIQIFLQSPWIIGLSALLFAILAFSMFSFFNIQLPMMLRDKLTVLNERVSKQYHGSLIGAALMGVFSVLIVSPCITAPLTGALLYIGSTHNAFFGGTALFIMGLGMGTPLFVVGIGLGHWLPKKGAWMKQVKAFFGFGMLGVALWLLYRIVPINVILILCGILFIGLAYCILPIETAWRNMLTKKFFATFTSTILFIYGSCLMVGGFMGHQNFIRPLSSPPLQKFHTTFKTTFITTITPKQLQALKKEAINKKCLLLLYFSAEWCSSCKQVDQELFTKKASVSLLANFMLVRFDITKTTLTQLKMMKAMNVFGAPTLIIYNNKGKEIWRHSGILSLSKFQHDIKALFTL